jgi:hypothetical protein
MRGPSSKEDGAALPSLSRCGWMLDLLIVTNRSDRVRCWQANRRQHHSTDRQRAANVALN